MKNNILAKNEVFLRIETLRKQIFYDRQDGKLVATDIDPTDHKQWGNFIAAHRELNLYLCSKERRTDIIIVVQEQWCMKTGTMYGFMVEYATKAVDYEEQRYRIEQYPYKQVYNCISIA